MDSESRRPAGAIGDHAVVIGASIAGLLAARVLAERYGRVTVVDRDASPATAVGRRAVPQGRHVHAILPRGQACGSCTGRTAERPGSEPLEQNC